MIHSLYKIFNYVDRKMANIDIFHKGIINKMGGGEANRK